MPPAHSARVAISQASLEVLGTGCFRRRSTGLFGACREAVALAFFIVASLCGLPQPRFSGMLSEPGWTTVVPLSLPKARVGSIAAS